MDICDIHTSKYHCADCHADAIVDGEVQFDAILIDDINGFRYVCEDCHRKAVRKAEAEDHDGFYAAFNAERTKTLRDLFTITECEKILKGLALFGKAEAAAAGDDWTDSLERDRLLRLYNVFKSALDD